MKGVEIERKFLLPSLPPIEPIAHVEVFQGYLSLDPEIRIRSYSVLEGKDKGHMDFRMTVKGEGGLVREEIEDYISEKFFRELRLFIGKPLIHKDFYVYQHNGHKIEVSIVDAGFHHEFIYGEVEFENVEDAKSFQWPFSNAKDITEVPDMKMKNYWKRTRL